MPSQHDLKFANIGAKKGEVCLHVTFSSDIVDLLG